jgi:hypothetical protein
LAPPALPGFFATGPYHQAKVTLSSDKLICASSFRSALSEAQVSRDPIGRVGVASTGSGLPPITQMSFSACRAHYPGGSVWYSLVRVDWQMALSRARDFPKPLWPSRNERPVGIHNFPFEACSIFTHVTACGFARPPIVDFVTRLPSRWLPTETARHLPRHIDNSWCGTLTRRSSAP